jgi:hypothetical protein
MRIYSVTWVVQFPALYIQALKDGFHFSQFNLVLLSELDIEPDMRSKRNTSFRIKVAPHLRDPFSIRFQLIRIVRYVKKACRGFQHKDLAGLSFLINPRPMAQFGKNIAQPLKPTDSFLRDTVRMMQDASSSIVKRTLQISSILTKGHGAKALACSL